MKNKSNERMLKRLVLAFIAGGAAFLLGFWTKNDYMLYCGPSVMIIAAYFGFLLCLFSKAPVTEDENF